MPLPRLIPCLDVADGRVVKGVRFQGLRDVGDPVELGAAYSDAGADELVFLDVTATSTSAPLLPELVSRVADAARDPVHRRRGRAQAADARSAAARRCRQGRRQLSARSSARR